MQILDVFSWLPKKEIDIDELTTIFLNSVGGIKDSVYEVVYQIPNDAVSNVIEASNELECEGKLVAYIKRGNIVIAIIGYTK